MGDLAFMDGSKSVGDTVNTTSGRVVANLTRMDTVQGSVTTRL